MTTTLGRIATTHVGSLPRVEAVSDLVFALEGGEAINAAVFASAIGGAAKLKAPAEEAAITPETLLGRAA